MRRICCTGVLLLLVAGCNRTEAEGHGRRGAEYLEQKQYDQAIQEFSEGIRLDPRNPDLYGARAQAYFGKKDYARAIADYDEALRLDPGDAEILAGRGFVSFKKGNYDRALADFTESIRIDPKQPASYNGFAWFLATCPEARFRDGKRAVTTAKTACELTGWKDGNHLDTLAAAYAESGDFENAVKWETKAIALGVPELETENAQKRLSLFKARKPFRDLE